MKTKKLLAEDFEFKIIYWILILLSSCIALGDLFIFQQLPSVIYFIAIWLSLPLQILFIYSVLVGKKKLIDNSEALTIFLVLFVIVHLCTNPYIDTPFAWFQFLFFAIDKVLAPIVLLWSGFKLFKPKLLEA
jgi:hypothetical protein